MHVVYYSPRFRSPEGVSLFHAFLYLRRGCNFGAVEELFFKRQAIEEISLLGLTASTKDLLSSRQVGAAHQG